MVNFGWNIATLIGLLYCGGALAYIGAAIATVVTSSQQSQAGQAARYVIQAAGLGAIFLISGAILLWNGWRLDPILQFQQLLILLAIAYLCVLDLILGLMKHRR